MRKALITAFAMATFLVAICGCTTQDDRGVTVSTDLFGLTESAVQTEIQS